MLHLMKHFSEGSVYCWGDNVKGQLGHNVDTSWKHFPTKIESLSRYHIVSSCAGDGFSIFLSNYGVVLSCGDNSQGCLGHENASSIMTPKAIGKHSEMLQNRQTFLICSRKILRHQNCATCCWQESRARSWRCGKFILMGFKRLWRFGNRKAKLFFASFEDCVASKYSRHQAYLLRTRLFINFASRRLSLCVRKK